MDKDININESAILETLNAKIDHDGGNYKGSGLANYVVDKSGDTMTGNLKLQSSWTQHVVQCITSLPYNQAPTNNTGVGKFQVLDKNGNYLMQTGCERFTDNRTTALLRVHSPADQSKSASATVYAYADGRFGFNFPMCTTKATTTSSARNDLVAVVVQNYVNGTSWYRVWSDGWCEQGGHIIDSANPVTVTLLKNYVNTNYSVICTQSAPASNNGIPVVHSKATNSFKVQRFYGNYGEADWQASGYIV